MPAIVDHVTVGTNYDRRRRLTEEDREDIKRDHAAGDSIHAIARCYGVSRRLVQFILYPERHEENKARREARGGSRAYYDKKINIQLRCGPIEHIKKNYIIKD